MASNNNLHDFMVSVADAIRAKGGTTDAINPQDFATKIAELPSGGGGVEEAESKDIDFYDYDGKRVASWTLAELATKTELPTPPSHDGLTFQGWNWTLEQLRTQATAMDVGALYVATDGVTRFYLDIPSETSESDRKLRFFLKFTASGNVIDWGDGTTATINSGLQTPSHTYSQGGKYVVSVNVVNGTMQIAYSSYNVIDINLVSNSGCPYLYKVVLGNNISAIEAYGFRYSTRLSEINIPQGTDSSRVGTFLGTSPLPIIIVNGSSGALTTDYAMQVCPSPTMTSMGSCAYYRGRRICIPKSVTSLGNNWVAYSNCIMRMVFPSSLASLPQQVVRQCQQLKYVSIPSSVTSIGAYAFFNCNRMSKLRFNGTTPPTIAASSTFQSLATSCVISVPIGCLSAYTSATNYPSSSTYTYIEE